MSHFEEQDSTHLKQAIAVCCANNIGGLLDFEPQILRAFIPVPDFFALFTQERDDILHHILRLDDGEAYTEFFEIGIVQHRTFWTPRNRWVVSRRFCFS